MGKAELIAEHSGINESEEVRKVIINPQEQKTNHQNRSADGI
jgi:hypothetical protein